VSEVTWVNSEQDLYDIITSNNRVIVDFTAPAWCRPCQQFAPHYERAAGTVQDVRFLAVDVDNNEWAMTEYGVQSVPTVMLYENGQFVRNVQAPQSAINLIKDLENDSLLH
jgi:thioredoxin 1